MNNKLYSIIAIVLTFNLINTTRVLQKQSIPPQQTNKTGMAPETSESIANATTGFT